MHETTHRCAEDLPQDGHGPAIDSCDEDATGVFWAGNSEYGTAVRFCPFCGQSAPTEPTSIARTAELRRRAAEERAR